MNYKTQVYRAEFYTFKNKPIEIAVLAQYKEEAKRDMYTVIHSMFNMHYGMITVKNLRKSNRRILSNMEGAKRCYSVNDNGEKVYWAWIRYE